ncbi:DUF6286 domain-containing Asp23/Gls24 family envelope stress response protein [Rhodococcus sp. WMMA185]|uniref:DUF6286 domain-containing Asp23/Gls24 family envelope stress response protein n=1 Tax=Rhodococcus sp. WMMA185 TaxID=679318 RepID=UPI0008781510|nr:DUF6286 domain-containing Asp23/Gls24 family envelope stress response protein [Rhodococcus sp. WMMA185]
MAEFSAANPPAEPDTDAAFDETDSRGTVVIKERAVVKIAVAAALEVPGVVKQSGGLSRFTGRDLPRADVSTGAAAVAINLYIAVRWPCRLDVLNRRLREEVCRRVEQMTGMPVHELNIVVAGTESSAAEELSPDTIYPEQVDSDSSITRAVPLRPRTPRATPAAVPAAVIVAVAALGLAVVAGRELLITRGTLGNAPWIRNTAEWLGRLHWSQWILPVAICSLIVGIVFIVAALKPRPRTHLPLKIGDIPTVWLRPTDLARNCSGHASAVPGVLSAHTTVDRKHVTVRVVRNEAASAAEVSAAVREVVEPTLSLLDTSPELRVQVKP